MNGVERYSSFLSSTDWQLKPLMQVACWGDIKTGSQRKFSIKVQKIQGVPPPWPHEPPTHNFWEKHHWTPWIFNPWLKPSSSDRLTKFRIFCPKFEEQVFVARLSNRNIRFLSTKQNVIGKICWSLSSGFHGWFRYLMERRAP